jgi:hypothetical protein
MDKSFFGSFFSKKELLAFLPLVLPTKPPRLYSAGRSRPEH